MENNQIPNRPQRKKMATSDLILIALAVLVMFRVDWSNMNSFHYLILFLLFLCFMLRWSNMRKAALQQQMRERYKAEFEAEEAKQAAKAALLEGEAAEAVPTEEMTVDGEAVPAEEAPVTEAAETAEAVEEEKSEN